MREIKFRAWIKNKKIMSYQTTPFYIDDEYLHLGFNIDIDIDLDDNLELMQYTGLKDKNGKEIYEGDIISGYRLDYFGVDGEQIVEVEWLNEDASFYPFSNNQDHMPYPKSSQVEVIGNIYKNPELLKKS